MSNQSKKAVVLLSGGLDSTVALHKACEKYSPEKVHALSLVYGQRHSVELHMARVQCQIADVPHTTIDVSKIFAQSKSSMLAHGADVAQGTYEEQLKRADAHDQNGSLETYVPFRNGLFISMATSFAYQIGAGVVVIAIHQDDSGAAYPDCSEEFLSSIGRSIRLGTGNAVRLYAPFASWTKAQIVGEGIRLGVSFKYTWSCYSPKDNEITAKPCLNCATCLDRAKAFNANNAVDPLSLL